VPTPVVVVVGLLEDVTHTCTAAFRESGDLVILVGGAAPDLEGSQYARVIQGRHEGRPAAVDLEAHRRAMELVRTAVSRQWLHSAHDCSDGGLAVALAECVLAQRMGAELAVRLGPSPEVSLFGEAPTRFVVSMSSEVCEEFLALAAQAQVPTILLGRTGGTRLRIADAKTPTQDVINLRAEALAAAHAALAEVLE